MRQVDTSTQMPQNVIPVHDTAQENGHLADVLASNAPHSSLITHTNTISLPCQDAAYNYYLLDSADNGLPEETEAWQPLSFDSLCAAAPVHASFARTSLFTGHSLQRVSDRAIPRTDNSYSGWGFIIFALIVTSIALYSNKHRFRLGDILRSAIDARTMSRTLRENNINRTSSLMPMTLVYAMTLSLLLLFVVDSTRFVLPFNHIVLNFAALFVAITLFFLLRAGLITLTGSTFCNAKSMLIYSENTSVYQFVGGVFLAPIVLLAFYSPLASRSLTHIAIGMLAFLFIMRFFRGVNLLASTIRHNHLFLLFYVCAFEIVPLLVLGKLYL